MQPHTNMVFLRGNLGNEPALRQTEKGVPVCNFRLATSERYKDTNGETKNRTQWHKVTVWGKMAELCGEYLEKGREVSIVGKLQTRVWTDKEGYEHEDVEVHTVSVEFLRKPGRKLEEEELSEDDI